MKINSIIKALCPGVNCSLYVNDFVICYRSKHTPDPQLFLNGSPIPVVEEGKFLGVIFDKKLISSSLVLLEK